MNGGREAFNSCPAGAVEQLWDVLRQSGWLPEIDLDLGRLELRPGCDLLEIVQQCWREQSEIVPSDNWQRHFHQWRRTRIARTAQLTWDWPGVASLAESRLMWWPDGPFTGRAVGVLSSRLGSNPQESPCWFDALRTLCSRLDPQHDLFVTCASTTTDRFIRRCAARFGLRLISLQLPMPRGQEAAQWLRHLGRLESTADRGAADCPVWLSPRIGEADAKGRGFVPEADWLVAVWVDELYVLHVRSGGQTQRLLPTLLNRTDRPRRIHLALGSGLVPLRVADSLLQAGAVGWHLLPCERDAPRPDDRTLVRAGHATATSASIVSRPAEGSWNYLVHWTRRQSGPWPDQHESAYLDELLFDCGRADRSALAALTRILLIQRIVATHRLTRGAVGVVCFTARHLSELLRFRTYRRHQRRWDFEPYGICIDRRWLDRRGARPVVYGDEQTWQQLSTAEQPFFQLRSSRPDRGPDRIDWTLEREWRHLGDVDLRGLPGSAGLVFVPTQEAAHQIARLSRWPVTVLRSDSQPDDHRRKE